MPDDLNQLTILLTGPQGTPYSQGLWKLFFKIPDDYPKSPPKVSFRTRIWHPNVEENSGAVCVDTLKRDWQSKLTLRDVLITISCLLIQPNPDSALNATAGHLLQDDYESFARQARLMTSIHAAVPDELREAVLAAKSRGEEPGAIVVENIERRPKLKYKSMTSSTVVMKNLPHRLSGKQLAPSPRQIVQEHDPTSDDDENSECKENDPMLSPSPVPALLPRRPMLAKRPLSDLPVPIETHPDSGHAPLLSPSEQNIANGSDSTSSNIKGGSSRKDSQLMERNTSSNTNGPRLHDVELIDVATQPLKDQIADGPRPSKRVCSEEGKENALEEHSYIRLPDWPLPVMNGMSRECLSNSRKASASGSTNVGSVKGKSRVGLRRL